MTETSRYTNMFNQTIQFSNWTDIELDEKDKQCIKVECVQMDTVGKWMDVCCSNSLPAICSKQLLQFNTSDVTKISKQTSASQSTQLTKQQTMSQSTQWTTMGQYSTKPTEQQTASQPTQWTEQQTTSQSTKSNLNLASSLTVQISTTLADGSSTADDILTSGSQLSTVTNATQQSSQTVESASVTLDSTGPTSELPSSPQITKTTEPYSSATHSELTHTSQSMTNSDEQSTTSKSSTESQTTPSTKPTRDCFCPCERTKNLLIIKNEAQLKAKIDMMRKDLAVNKPLLSSSIRRKISVSDSRPSSIVIGSTLGISLLTLVLVLIFVSDFHHLVTDIRHGLINTRRALLFLKNHVGNVKNRTIFASQDFSGQTRSPENSGPDRKHLAFDKRSGPKIPRHDYTSIKSFVFCNK
ncbi:uncharacterized protein [Magallana gigas]|uniref:uncharacterized protein n=1 Tax=Magallana gigas TaxID=29159 RepID=UPI0033426BB5